MSRYYPKHKFALEVNVLGYIFATLYNEQWVARKVFDHVKIGEQVVDVRLWHNHRIIARKRADRRDDGDAEGGSSTRV